MRRLQPGHLLFVLTNLVFLHIKTVHDLLHRPLQSLFLAQKDAFYRFKKAEWSWGPFYRRFLALLGRRLHWSKTARENCLILDTSALPKRGKRLENLSFVYDHSQGKTVKGYEILTLGLLTPGNFYPVNFGHHFSQTAPAEVREAQPLKARGDLARRLQEARVDQTGLGPEDAQGRPGARLFRPVTSGGRLVYFPHLLSQASKTWASRSSAA